MERPIPRRCTQLYESGQRDGEAYTVSPVRKPGHLRGMPNVSPSKSINFVTCHDGFTLNDLVSYNGKHNEANGENNCDGAGCQSELELRAWKVPSDDPAIERLRKPHGQKSFHRHACFSVGTPMLLMGGRSSAHLNAETTMGIVRITRSVGLTGPYWKKHRDIYRFCQNALWRSGIGGRRLSCPNLTLNQFAGAGLASNATASDCISPTGAINLTAWQ